MEMIRKKGRTAAIVTVALFAAILIAAFSTHLLGLGLQAAPQSSTTAVETVTSVGKSCTDPSLSAAVVQVEQDPRFIRLSDGLCYSFLGDNSTTIGGSGSSSVYTFDYYNGSVIYPCGNVPEQLAVSQIQAQVVTNGAGLVVQTAQLSNDTSSINFQGHCGPDLPAVSVVRAQLVEATIPAILAVNLTLDTRFAALPVTSLRAVMVFPGANQTIEFPGVTPATPLLPDRPVSQTMIIAGPPGFVVGGVYDMTIEGQFQGGQSFGYTVQIALVNA